MESPIFTSCGIKFSSEIIPDEKIKVTIEINSEDIRLMLHDLEDRTRDIGDFSFERIVHTPEHSHIIIIGLSILKMIYLVDSFTVSTLRIEYGRYRPMTIKAINILEISKQLYKSDEDSSSLLEERSKLINELLMYEEEEASKSLLQRQHERYREIRQRDIDEKEARKQRLIEKNAKQLEDRAARRIINSNISEADRIAGIEMRDSIKLDKMKKKLEHKNNGNNGKEKEECEAKMREIPVPIEA